MINSIKMHIAKQLGTGVYWIFILKDYKKNSYCSGILLWLSVLDMLFKRKKDLWDNVICTSGGQEHHNFLSLFASVYARIGSLIAMLLGTKCVVCFFSGPVCSAVSDGSNGFNFFHYRFWTKILICAGCLNQNHC